MTDLARAIREAILTFEPRILPATLQIRTLLEAGDLDHHNVIGVEIHGQLWAQPVPLEFLVRTEFDLETGKVQIADLAPAAGGVNGSAPPSVLQPRAAAPARDGRRVRRSSFRRLRPGSGCTGWRWPIPTWSGCSKASGFWRRACSSSSTPSSRASRRRCSRSSIRTTWRRRRRCWSRSSRPIRTIRTWPAAPRCRAAARCRACWPPTMPRRVSFAPRTT